MGDIVPKTVDLTKIRLDIKGAWKWLIGAIAFFVLLEIAKWGAAYIMSKLFGAGRKAAGGGIDVI